MSEDRRRDIIEKGHLATLATIRRSGRPQLSEVSYTYDRARDVVRVSITADRAKTANLRRDPRATLLVHGDNVWTYAVADVDVTLWPRCIAPDDASADELVDIYRHIAGEHPDWAEFRAAMVAEGRLPAQLAVTHVYGQVP